MSKFRPKNGGTPEVHSARSKLDGLLQNLVDKKDDSFSSQHSDIKQELDSSPEAGSSTPTKRSALMKHSRKRKRGRDEPMTPEMGQYHHTYVMKLFDRSVDLAQFDDSTPLYPICRAWMRNQPHNRNLAPRERTPSPEPEPSHFDEDEEGESLYKLPGPVLFKTEDGDHIDLRVPSPVPQTDEPLDIHADPATAPAPEQLLLNHMVRWKQTRQRWKEAGRSNESRYAESLNMLKNMFDKQIKDQ